MEAKHFWSKTLLEKNGNAKGKKFGTITTIAPTAGAKSKNSSVAKNKYFGKM